MYWHESATGLHMSPPSWTSFLPHPTPLGCPRALVWVSWVIQHTPAGSLAYLWKHVCFCAALYPYHPLLPSSCQCPLSHSLFTYICLEFSVGPVSGRIIHHEFFCYFVTVIKSKWPQKGCPQREAIIMVAIHYFPNYWLQQGSKALLSFSSVGLLG